VFSLVFSANSSLLAAGLADIVLNPNEAPPPPFPVVIWDLGKKGRKVCSLEQKGDCYPLAGFFAKDTMLAGKSNKGVTLWDLKTRQPTKKLTLPDSRPIEGMSVFSLDISADGSYLAVGAEQLVLEPNEKLYNTNTFVYVYEREAEVPRLIDRRVWDGGYS